MIDVETRARRGEGTIYRVLGEEAVLLNLDSGEYYSLNPLGVAVWQLCDGNTTIREIIHHVCAEYEVAWDRAERDVLGFVRELAEEGLVTLEATAEGA